MWPFYLTILILTGILILPFLVVFLLLNFFTVGLANLGLSAGAGFLVVLAMIFGSFINLPLSKKEAIKLQDQRFFGMFKREIVINQGLSINVGGAIIPLFITSILIPNAPLQATIIATIGTILVSYKMARVIPGIGISMPPLFTVFTAVVLSLFLAPENPEIVAFISGVLGTLIGADLLNMNKVMKIAHSTMIVGGAGVFDGIFLTGIIASLLAGI
ncbi:MAG: DUF1614 domain-containing protein [Patescibacteria group bacterium]